MATDPHNDHGHSVAIWTAVAIILVGAAVCSIATWFGNVPLVIVGLVIAALGVVAGKVLAMAGYGSKSEHTAPVPDASSQVADAAAS